MKNIKWSILGVLAAATLLAACDPYKSQSTAAPTVIMVTSTDPASGTNTPGTESGGAWTVSGVPSTCGQQPDKTFAVTSDEPVLFVTANQLLDGASIQTSVSDCTPAGSWLTVSPPAPDGEMWYSCFNPGAPSPDVGSSVVIFRAPNATPAQGWAGASITRGLPGAVATYHFTGAVRDWQGQSLPIDVTVDVTPNPGSVDIGFTTFTATGLTVTWSAAACGGVADYTVERAPDVSGAPGTFVAITTTPLPATTLTFADPGPLTPGTVYWYRVTANSTAAGYKVASQRSTNPAALEAPTLSAVTATTLDVSWVAASPADVETYDVQRAPDNAGAPGTWADIATALPATTLTFADSGLTAGAVYWYRVVANNRYGTTNGAARSTKATAADAPDISNVTATGLTLTWTAVSDANAYDVQRAPDVSGAPGTFAPIATGLTATTFTDSGLTDAAVYWYFIVSSNGHGTATNGVARSSNPTAPKAPTIAYVSTTAADVSWTTTSDANTYDVQRALDVSGAPGTFAAIATGLTASPFSDTSLTAGTVYWYRIVAKSNHGSATGAQASNVPTSPAAPTFTAVTSTSLTVNWTAVPSATSYDVQRAGDVYGQPLPFQTIAPAVTGTTYNDTGLTAATKYWYRIVAKSPLGSANGAPATVTTP